MTLALLPTGRQALGRRPASKQDINPAGANDLFTPDDEAHGNATRDCGVCRGVYFGEAPATATLS